MNQSFTCQVYNQTIPKNKDIDQIRCNIQNFSAFLHYNNFGYICMMPLGLIIIISIFGGIKANYRWFILNQAIWDLIVSNQYSCSLLYNNAISSCFYLTPFNSLTALFILLLMEIYTRNNFFCALSLLSISRFMALYFTKMYEKITKNYRIFFTIIIFNIFIILSDSYNILSMPMTARLTAFVAECQSQGNFSTTECTAKRNSDSLYFFYYVLFQSFQIISYSKPIIFIFLSIFSTSAICIKVVKNAKFQLKHNRADFISSIRIAAVFCLQIFVNFIVLVIEYISLIEKWLINVYGLKAFTWKYQVPAGKDPKEYWDFRLPLWLNGDYGLVSDPARQMLSQFRVFTESIIVLFLMTGYREALVKFVKFIFAAIENPKNAYHRFKSRITQTKVTSIAVNSIK